MLYMTMIKVYFLQIIKFLNSSFSPSAVVWWFPHWQSECTKCMWVHAGCCYIQSTGTKGAYTPLHRGAHRGTITVLAKCSITLLHWGTHRRIIYCPG